MTEPTQYAEPQPSRPDPSLARRAQAIAVNNYVAMGWRPESSTDDHAILVKGTKPNHVLHLLLCCCTFGLWLPVWIIMSIVKRPKRVTITTNEWGQSAINQL